MQWHWFKYLNTPSQGSTGSAREGDIAIAMSWFSYSLFWAEILLFKTDDNQNPSSSLRCHWLQTAHICQIFTSVHSHVLRLDLEMIFCSLGTQNQIQILFELVKPLNSAQLCHRLFVKISLAYYGNGKFATNLDSNTLDISKQLLLKTFFDSVQKDSPKSNLLFALYIVNLKEKFFLCWKKNLFSAEMNCIWWDDWEPDSCKFAVSIICY